MASKQGSSGIRQIRTICSLCPCQDGIIATVEGGRVTALEGDRDHPVSGGYTCFKARHAWESLYHPHRFKQPLLKTDRGWKGITWDEALDIAADRLYEVKQRYGPLSLCAASCFPFFSEGIAMKLFMRSLGSPNEMNNLDLCQGPSRVGDMATLGHVHSIYEGAQDFRHSRTILLVGTNMAVSAGGQWQDILEARKGGARLIVVDPRRTETVGEADIWLQIRPGTDGALALGMLNVIIAEGLYDRDFVGSYCQGFEELRDHVQQYTLERVSGITWLHEDEISRAARLFAGNRPSSYRGNNGVSQHSNSLQAARAFSALVAVTGNIDVEGANLLPTVPAGFETGYKLLQQARLPREVEEKRLGAAAFPLWAGPDSLMDAAHNPSVLRAIITGEPYPVKAMIINGANPIITYPDTRKVMEALKRLEFLMVLAYTPSPTSEYADLILPRTHPLEENSVAFSSYGSWLGAAPKVTDAPEGCFDTVNILRRLGERMLGKGYIEKGLIPWKDMDQFIAFRLEKVGTDFRRLCDSGPVAIERKYRKYAERGFRTPSGKVELYSSLLQRHGYAPLPTFTEPGESPLSAPHMAKKYPLLLTTRREQDVWLSRSAGEAWLRKRIPYSQLEMHPQVAADRGIREGDLVMVETPRGACQHRAKVTGGIHPQVVNGVFGWWLPEREAPERGALECNINAVMSYDPPYDPGVGINDVQGVMCQVRKV